MAASSASFILDQKYTRARGLDGRANGCQNDMQLAGWLFRLLGRSNITTLAHTDLAGYRLDA
jgi:hypothetical protein